MKFLIEGSIQVLTEEGLRKLEPLERHPRSLPVPVSGNVRPSCSHLPEQGPYGCRQHDKQGGEYPEESGTSKEFTLCRKCWKSSLYETDILAEVLDSAFRDARNHYAGRRYGCIAFVAAGNVQMQRISLGGHVASLCHIIVRVFHRVDGEVAAAARNEWIFI